MLRSARPLFRYLARYLARLPAVLALAAIAAQPAMAQSVLRDAETEAFLHDMGAPLIEAAGLQPDNVDIVLLDDPSINAFVAGGQTVYVHSGLIEAADNAGEVQGVVAHELGHITGGHIIRQASGARAATNVSLLSLVAGLGAMLAGAGDAGMAAMMLGQRAAIGKFLAYSRSEEASADAAGAKYLSKAGISGRGSLDFFGKLANLESRYGISRSDDAEFLSSHPLTSDRIATLREVYKKDPAWNKPDDPALQARFLRIKGKLEGYLDDPAKTLRDYPPGDNSIPAHYARAYAYHKDADTEKALAETDALIKSAPDDPYFLELQGQILLESGHPDEALAALRKATELSRSQPLIATLFGHALIATEDPSHYPEAEKVLRAAVGRDRYNPFAWRQLGVVYAASGDMARANLATAEQQVITGDYVMAVNSARNAEAGLPEGSPDRLRAQDVEMQARALFEQQRAMQGKN